MNSFSSSSSYCRNMAPPKVHNATVWRWWLSAPSTRASRLHIPSQPVPLIVYKNIWWSNMAACKTGTMFSRTCPHSERLDSKIRSRRNSAEKLCMGGVHRGLFDKSWSWGSLRKPLTLPSWGALNYTNQPHSVSPKVKTCSSEIE